MVVGEAVEVIGHLRTEAEAGRRTTTVATDIPEAAAKRAAGAANETNAIEATAIQTQTFDATFVTSVTVAIAT